MEFTNRFVVQAPLPAVWSFMLNAQEVAPCVPGAQITEIVDETHFKGTVKVKLGAVSVSYRGELEMQPDQASRTIILNAKGTELRGNGGASGTVTTTLVSGTSGATEVTILSQIDVTGKVAQFGRGIMQDVATRLIREFSQCLEGKIVAGISPDSTTAASDSADDLRSFAAEKAPPPEDSEKVSVEGMAEVPHARTYPAPAEIHEASELRLSGLLVEILRSRVAAGLRAVATRIEPK